MNRNRKKLRNNGRKTKKQLVFIQEITLRISSNTLENVNAIPRKLFAIQNRRILFTREIITTHNYTNSKV